MPVPTLNGLPPFANVEDMKNKLNSVVGEINNLLVSLDTLNIVELNAKVITAGSITGDKIQADSITSNHIQANAVTADEIQAGAVSADKIQAGAVSADKIQAGAVTASKIDVDYLSAISADLGTITAGLIQSIQIFGSYIATQNGTYPRAEMSSSNNLFAVYIDANNSITIVPNDMGSPALNLTYGGSVKGQLNTRLGLLSVEGRGGAELFAETGNIFLTTSNEILITQSSDFSKIKPSLSSTNLQSALNSKATVGASTNSVSGGSHNHGIPNGAQLLGADGVTVYTWSAYGGFTHSHTQN
ncbi:hypothetical protein KIH86_23895 [Paenibacillus sp. HN-1]|uniref:hypothetical protein n=1 Tax=Paenibacillus TaxID=44249 RepID=UPI001CA9AB74|nr:MULTISPECIES: hypothetical protein [Paenibacillus]MBY9081194.1 hypothetical protein [Paenibacillus sp. CGMCC 1.18879]MBY9087231.1 hypothetical protein [Paenibacillus sinensis]